MGRTTDKDKRDERGSAIHPRGDCVQLDVGENLLQLNRFVTVSAHTNIFECFCYL